MKHIFQNKINDLIGYRTDDLLEEINRLWKELGINFSDSMTIDSIDAVFVKGINLQNGFKDAIRQIDTKPDQYLSIRYKIDGKQHTLKSFGKTGKIQKQKIIKILKLVTLIKIVKELNQLSYLASGVRFLERIEPH